MEYRLTTPCTAEDLAPLKAGDTVLLSGVVYTARDQAHRRMTEALEKGEPLPFDLTGSAADGGVQTRTVAAGSQDSNTFFHSKALFHLVFSAARSAFQSQSARRPTCL